MTEQQFKALRLGDLIRPKGEVHSFVVMDNYGGRITAVRTVDVTNPIEWDLMYTAQHELIAPTNTK